MPEVNTFWKTTTVSEAEIEKNQGYFSFTRGLNVWLVVSTCDSWTFQCKFIVWKKSFPSFYTPSVAKELLAQLQRNKEAKHVHMWSEESCFHSHDYLKLDDDLRMWIIINKKSENHQKNISHREEKRDFSQSFMLPFKEVSYPNPAPLIYDYRAWKWTAPSQRRHSLWKLSLLHCDGHLGSGHLFEVQL